MDVNYFGQVAVTKGELTLFYYIYSMGSYLSLSCEQTTSNTVDYVKSIDIQCIIHVLYLYSKQFTCIDIQG